MKGIRKTDLSVKEISKKLEDSFELFQRHLEKPEFYGAVGVAQSEFNPIWSRAIGRSKTGMARRIKEKVGEAAWRDQYATNRGGIEHMITVLNRGKKDTPWLPPKPQSLGWSKLSEEELKRIAQEGSTEQEAALR